MRPLFTLKINELVFFFNSSGACTSPEPRGKIVVCPSTRRRAQPEVEGSRGRPTLLAGRAVTRGGEAMAVHKNDGSSRRPTTRLGAGRGVKGPRRRGRGGGRG